MPKPHKIIVQTSIGESPAPHELWASQVIANFFKSDVVFLRTGHGHTPDIKIIKNNQIWEIKSPMGNSPQTIANNFRKARKQSGNVIISLYRCKMNQSRALARIKHYLLERGDPAIKKTLVILKTQKVIDIFGNVI